MGTFEGLLYGLEIAAQPEFLLAALAGVLVGSLVGVLPGLGPGAGGAVMFPLTYVMDPAAGLIMLAGLYYGVQYGGSTTAVLLNIPGETGSIVAAIEGYPMAQRGRAGAALGVMAFGSFFAGTLAVVAVTIASPLFARLGLLFGPIEFFALTLGGLLVLSRMLGGSFAGGVLPMLLGLLIGTIGADAASGTYRFAFGNLQLGRGIGVVPVAIGLFGISEILRLGETGMTKVQPPERMRIRDVLPTRKDWRESVWPWARGGTLGFLIGLLPGPSATISTFASYRMERALCKDKSRFGRDFMPGLAGPEAANNAGATASMIPVLSLGLPFSPILALMLAALVAHGVDPGPQIVERHPEIFWAVIGSMYIGNVMLLIINLPLINVWIKLLTIRFEYMIPLILVLSTYGTYAVSGSLQDVLVVLLIGLLGYVMRVYGFQLAPLIIGLILGPMVERHFVSAMIIGNGDPMVLLSTPVAKVLWGTAGLTVIVGSYFAARSRRLRQTEEVVLDV